MRTAGIYDLAEESLSELSGTAAKGIYIAMLLAQNTDIVFLDEPVTFWILIISWNLWKL